MVTGVEVDKATHSRFPIVQKRKLRLREAQQPRPQASKRFTQRSSFCFMGSPHQLTQVQRGTGTGPSSPSKSRVFPQPKKHLMFVVNSHGVTAPQKGLGQEGCAPAPKLMKTSNTPKGNSETHWGTEGHFSWCGAGSIPSGGSFWYKKGRSCLWHLTFLQGQLCTLPLALAVLFNPTPGRGGRSYYPCFSGTGVGLTRLRQGRAWGFSHLGASSHPHLHPAAGNGPATVT